MAASILYSAIVGIIAGWLAGQISRSHGFGLWGDLAVGIVGSVIGNFVFSLIGLQTYGLIGSVIASTIGAIILLWAMRLFTGTKTAS